MKQDFIPHKFSAGSLKIIEKANEILTAYQAEGYTVTLRQLYYQFVARDLLPNKQSEYKRLGTIISDARLAGLVDWDTMEDRTRAVHQASTWDFPSEIVRSAAYSYKEDLWRTQPYRPEVWVEKDALLGVVERICLELRVSYFACRGYASQSAQYEAGARLRSYRNINGQKPIILHLGDHDPSGIDMTRDNAERLSLFARSPIEVKRLALNMDQIQKHKPPPNPAKETDSRSGPYRKLYGDSSWELDSLEPSVLASLIREAVNDLIVPEAWEKAAQEEGENKQLLELASKRWKSVATFLQGEK